MAIDCDDIKQTINSSDLYDIVVTLFSKNKYKLIKCLAHKITIYIINELKLWDFKLIILKPNLPINVILDTVEMEVNKIV